MPRRLRLSLKTASALLVVAFLAPPAGRAAPRPTAIPPTGTPTVAEDADWVLAAQLADGAIAHHVDRVEVWPYLGNYGAMGLARAGELTGDRRYSEAAWRWLSWYQAHQDPDGFVTDYRVLGHGSLVSKGDMDSTDAYAGTFLLAARRTWMATRDGGRLATLRPGIARAVAAIQATQDADGLTWAKPSWRVKYLMDQAEAYAGLSAARDLATLLGDQALADQAGAAAQRLAAGVSRLWNPAAGAYDWAVHEDGARQATDWATLYPDAQQQAWAVAFGLATGTRATGILDRLDAAQPYWDRPQRTARYDSGARPVGYWPVTGWAFSRAGRTSRALVAAGNIRAAALAAHRAWDYTPATSSQLIQLQSSDVAWLP